MLICGSRFNSAYLHCWDLRNNTHGERKQNRTKIVQNGGFNPFSFSLMFGNPNRATGGGALEGTINATIDNEERLSDCIKVSDELFTFGE